MEKLTFKRQLFLGIVLIIAGNILAFTFFSGNGDASCWHGDSYFFACDQELGEIGGIL